MFLQSVCGSLWYLMFPFGSAQLRKSGQLKLLAVSSAQCSLAVPNFPTIVKETVEPELRHQRLGGIFAPRARRVRWWRLKRDVDQILGPPNIRKRLVGDDADPVPMSVGQFRHLVRSEIRRS